MRVLHELTLAASVLAAGVALRVGVFATLDMRDLPGPGSALTLAVALTDGEITSAYLAVLRALGDPFVAGPALALVSGTVVVLGTLVAGRALGGPRAGLCAAAVAALFGPWVLNSTWLAGEGPALALMTLGLGLFWSRGPWPVLGAGLVLGSVFLRETVAPLACLTLVAPALVEGRRRWVLGAAALGVTVGTVALVYAVIGDRYTGTSEDRTLAELWLLWFRPADVVLQLVGVAAVAVAWPGERRLARAATLGGGLAILAVAMMQGGESLRPRHLHALWFPFLVLVGWLAAQARGAWWALAGLGVIGLGVDTIDRVHAFETARVAFHGATPSGWPAAPTGWQRESYPRWRINGFSAPGAPELAELRGRWAVAIPRLHDDRHLLAVAVVLADGGQGRTIERNACCSGLDDAACGAALAADLTGWVVLPLHEEAVEAPLVQSLRDSLGPPDETWTHWQLWDRRGRDTQCSDNTEWLPR